MCDNVIHSLRFQLNIINFPLCFQCHRLSNNFKINPKYSGGLCSHNHLCFSSCQFFTLYSSSLWLFLYLCPSRVTAYLHMYSLFKWNFIKRFSVAILSKQPIIFFRLNDYLSYSSLLNFFLPNWNVSSKKVGVFVYFLPCRIPQKFRTVSDPQETLNNVCWLICGPLLTMLIIRLSPEGVFSNNFPRDRSYLSKNNYGGSCEDNKILVLVTNNINTLKEQNVITK